jgi:hypothetical protein
MVGIQLVLIPGVSFLSTSGVIDLGHPLMATRGAKFQCSQRQGWMLKNVYLEMLILDTFLQLAVITHLTQDYYTLLLLRFKRFPRLCQTDTMIVVMQ